MSVTVFLEVIMLAPWFKELFINLEWKNTQRSIQATMDSFFGGAKMEKAKEDLKESFVWGLEIPDNHPSVNSKSFPRT